MNGKTHFFAQYLIFIRGRVCECDGFYTTLKGSVKFYFDPFDLGEVELLRFLI